ncbi:MAG: hypothetical protein ACTSWQ_08660 [Candidatus Thorarchaeota archaeon]
MFEMGEEYVESIVSKIAKDLNDFPSYMSELDEYKISLWEYMSLIAYIYDLLLRMGNRITGNSLLIMNENKTGVLLSKVLRKPSRMHSRELNGQQVKEIARIDRFSELMRFLED